MESITPKEFEDLRSGDKPLIVIDVRERWEHEEENIGALNIPLCTIPSKLKELEKYQNSQIVCHCKTGKRSRQAAKYLEKSGFKNVLSLEGGIQAYLSQNLTAQD
ncbi:MAG: rhodanese-like domain-containing protein [Bacteroidota bacterium]